MSASTLATATRCIFTAHDTILSDLLNLFRDNERQLSVEDDGDGGSYVQLRYESRVGIIRDRLEAMGYDLRASRRAFDEGMIVLREEVAREASQHAGADVAAPLHDAIEVYKQHSFENWLRIFPELWSDEETVSSSDVTFFERDARTENGFPELPDRLFYVRAALEGCSEAEIISHDLSTVINAFGYNPADFCPEETDQPFPAVTTRRKLIIITEGTSDRRILRLALRLLYPHLVEFWSFLEFEGANQQGGAPEAVRLVKGMAAAGVSNRVVAVFDNDTAAAEALLALRKTMLPDNIRIVVLPQLELANHYPTIGPSGEVEHLNVNGCAVSVELYLGPEILTPNGSGQPPVHWRGYNDALKRYQGEVQNKASLVEAFVRRAEECIAEPSRSKEGEWEDLRSILDSIRTAFSR